MLVGRARLTNALDDPAYAQPQDHRATHIAASATGRLGAHGLARDAASGVAGVQEGRGGPQMIRKLNPRKMRRLRWTGLLLIVLALF